MLALLHPFLMVKLDAFLMNQEMINNIRAPVVWPIPFSDHMNTGAGAPSPTTSCMCISLLSAPLQLSYFASLSFFVVNNSLAFIHIFTA